MIRFYLKDPDGFYESVTDYVMDEIEEERLDELRELNLDDKFIDAKRDAIFEKLEKWVDFHECVTLEYDPITDTMRVVELNK